MGHEIFGARFMSNRVPAWHKLGYVTDVEMNAREALGHIGGDLNYTLSPLFAEVGGERLELPQCAVVRHPTAEEPEYVSMGIVDSANYALFTPGEICDIWDSNVSKKVETMGILQRGGMFFVTAKLQTIDVKGDEVQRYLMLVNAVNGTRSMSAVESPVRTVCMNTLRMAETAALVNYKVAHDRQAKERIGLWLKEAVSVSDKNYETTKATFEILAGKRVNEAAAKAIITASYPNPNRPAQNAPTAVVEGRNERWEKALDLIARRRDMAFQLFSGDGTGMELPAAKGTLWGLYNAVVELEDYRKSSFQGGERMEAVRAAESSLFGERADTKKSCLGYCVEEAEGKFFASQSGARSVLN